MIPEKREVLEKLYLLKNFDISELTDIEKAAFNKAVEAYEICYVEKLYHHGLLSKTEYLKVLANDVASVLITDIDTITCPKCENCDYKSPLVITTDIVKEGDENHLYYRAYCPVCGYTSIPTPDKSAIPSIYKEIDNNICPPNEISVGLVIMDDNGITHVIDKIFTKDKLKKITGINAPEEDEVGEYLYIVYVDDKTILPYLHYKSSKDISSLCTTNLSVEDATNFFEL